MISILANTAAPCLALCAAVFLLAAPAAAGSPRPAVHPAASARSVAEGLFTGDGFEGTFLQLTVGHRARSQQQWRAELDNLSKLGFDTLVLQWSVYDDVSFIEDGGAGPSTVERILAAADEVGFDCYLGLSLRNSWWKAHEITEQFLQDELSRNIEAARRLYPRAERFRSFRGWYIPHEVTELISTEEQRDSIIGFFSGLSASLKQLNPQKSILASGYTDPRQANLVRFVLRWAEFLDRAGIDVLIFQDGAGTRGRDWRAILPFVEAVAILDEEFVGDIWLLAEAFDQTHGPPLNNEPFQARPARIERIREQLEALGHFRKKLIVFSYFEYMRPGDSENATQLFEAYRQLTEKRVLE
jgi:hypothetical protein